MRFWSFFQRCALRATLASLWAVGVSTPVWAAPESPVPSPTAASVTPECQALVRRLPNVTLPQCQQAGLNASAARSVQGRRILLTDVLPTETPQLRVLVLGGMHGDEPSSSSVALHWLHWARDGAFALPQPVHWRFIPALNPDGLLMARPRRTNANGVDLNRNFPTPEWERDAPRYWAQRTGKDPRRWPGKVPLSEPESRYLHEQMQQFKPHLIVSLHAPYGVLDFDGPITPPSRLGRLYLDQVGIYPGSLGHYAGVHKAMPVVTVELASAKTTPREAEMRQMWVDLLRWMSERLMSAPLGR